MENAFCASLSKNAKSRHDYRNSRELSNGKQEREITGILEYWIDGKVGWWKSLSILRDVDHSPLPGHCEERQRRSNLL